mgnify:CR=1 FL=1
MDAWPDWAWDESPLLALVLTYLGSPRSDGNPHKNGYDGELMTRILHDAGFGRVELSKYMGSDDPVLRIDDNSEAAQATYLEKGKTKHFSLFVEARRWYADT